MRNKLGRYVKGFKPESGMFKKGHKTWNKGKKFSMNTRKKMKKAKQGMYFLSDNPNWKGGRYKKDGYIFIYKPKHPYCSQIGYVREHRLIVEKQIGRYLLPKEKCHHLGKKDDNRLHMLMAFINDSAHQRFANGSKVKLSEIIFDGNLVDKKSA